jgi:signal peptidase II
MKRSQALGNALIAALVVFGADRWLKNVIVESMELGQSMPLLGPLRLTYVHNTGAAFSLLAGNPLLLAGFSLLVLVGIIVYMFKLGGNEPKITLTLAILAGGAAGNLYDRVMHSYVVDYLDIGFWPVFNLADVAIVLSCAALVFQVWYKERASSG